MVAESRLSLSHSEWVAVGLCAALWPRLVLQTAAVKRLDLSNLGRWL